MEMWRTASFMERHLKAMIASSHLLSPAIARRRRTFKTLASPPPAAAAAIDALFRPPEIRPFGFLLVRSSRPVNVRALSSVSSGQEIEHRDQQQSSASCSDDEAYNDHLLEVQQEKQSRFVPVKAYFVSTSVDLRSLQAQNAFNVIPPTSRASNYVVLRYYDIKAEPHGLEAGFVNESNCHYMVVFQYGSVVLFNVSDHEADGYLKIVEKHTSGLLPEMRKDDYAVVEKPTLDTWMQSGLDYIMLKTLSIDGIRTIGSVLGQSIALDYYIRQVDGMVAEFTDINRGMEKTRTFTMQRKKLFQLVGKANSNLADVILKLGLFERWKVLDFPSLQDRDDGLPLGKSANNSNQSRQGFVQRREGLKVSTTMLA